MERFCNALFTKKGGAYVDTVTVAKVAVKAATYAIDKPYDYDIPRDLLPRLKPGMRVILPFGPGSRRTERAVSRCVMPGCR